MSDLQHYIMILEPSQPYSWIFENTDRCWIITNHVRSSHVLNTTHISSVIISAECKAVGRYILTNICQHPFLMNLHIDLSNNFDACVSALYHENGQI